MNVSIMQPYLFPYIGYFQLINSSDKFIIYDNIKYTKKGWINRNRILVNGKDQMITAPLKKDSDFLNIDQRLLSDDWNIQSNKMYNLIKESYKKSPHFKETINLIEECLFINSNNLFDLLYTSVTNICNFLNIKTEIIISSSLNIDHTLKCTDKVIEICKNQNTKTYINAIGGMELYDKGYFESHDINLKFIKSNPIIYTQFNNDFIPWLSIIDVMMFNSKEKINEYLNSYTLI